jgi:hypothetical protein
MAVNQSRSMNMDLREGATDGKYRKARPDTTVAVGLGDEIVKANRSSLHPFQNYGFPNTQYPNPVTNTRTEF